MRIPNWEQGLTWDDVPAILLASVSALTVMTGARLLRGQSPALMLVLGIGVAGSTFVLERRLVERFSAVRPEQSFFALVLCWAPMFLFATSLATFATFSWIAPEVTRRDLEESQRLHWTSEVENISTYLVNLTTAVRRQTDATQKEIEAERRRVTAARVQGVSYSPDALRSLQRKLAAMRDLDRRISGLQRLPIDLPPAEAQHTLVESAFRDLADVHASAALSVSALPSLPHYEPFMPPSSDLQSVLMEETRKRTWRAIVAWGAALWVELLPLLALWRGGRKVPLSSRMLQWRTRVKDTADALRGRHTPAALPIVIEPLNVRGVVRVAVPSEYTLTDCTPLLEEAVEQLTSVVGPYDLKRISNARGERLDDRLPLLPQLNGQPLVLSVEESHA